MDDHVTDWDPCDRREVREHNRLIDEIDAELAEIATPEYQAEHAARMARRERWENLPRFRLRPGVPTHRLTDQEAAKHDDEGY